MQSTEALLAQAASTVMAASSEMRIPVEQTVCRSKVSLSFPLSLAALTRRRYSFFVSSLRLSQKTFLPTFNSRTCRSFQPQ